MPAFKFTKVNPGDVLTIDYDLSSIGEFAKIKEAILSAGITGTWSSDYKKFTVNTISGNSTIDLIVNKYGVDIDFSSLSLNDTFYMGKYQVGSETPWDIEWEIVHQESDYQIAMVKQIIDLRCFDAKESSNSSGNNNWGASNIEQWLNSDASAGNWYSAQHSYDAPPNKDNCWHYSNGTTYNAYDTHKGFLYHWSNEDKALLKDYTLTLANNTVTDGGGSYTWTGKVFLPTYTQMGFGNNNSISEGIQFNKFTNNTSRIKSLHPNCIANNEYCKVTNGNGNWLYWMSSVDPSFSNYARYVYSDGLDYNSNAYYGYIGLAPCICLPRHTDS